MDHSGIDHSGMDHSSMDHSSMDHSSIAHSSMDHSGMDHLDMDHSGMDHAAMSHSVMDTTIPDMEHQHHMTHGSHSSDGMDHGMAMSFHFGYNEVILFDWWSISSIGGLIGSMVGIFILALLYEGMKYWREHLMQKALAKQYSRNKSKQKCVEENRQLQCEEKILIPPKFHMMSTPHAVQTVLHMFQMVVSYFLMLIFMTYNVWLCIAVVLGAGLGYFLFGWQKSTVVDMIEHCH